MMTPKRGGDDDFARVEMKALDEKSVIVFRVQTSAFAQEKPESMRKEEERGREGRKGREG